ncbi:MAG: AarF/ABC1/UbiB kinase family protein [Flavobacteriales bacterium]|nr:AarF/ABC1/UbiB kinase family protein [Flavobacteriales bacterium]
MQSQANLFSPGVRKRKAYSTAFRVFFSYSWLGLKSKFLGKNHYSRNVKSLHRQNADRIRDRIQELQGLFIKFGQLISSMSNILPEEFRAPLKGLQDQIIAKPYSEIERTIEKELGSKPDQLFTHFNKEPLAAASIGQVHKAEIDGVQVAVKIQHENIDTIAHVDLEIIEKLVKLFAAFMDMQGLEHTYQQVRQMIEEELDYVKEASAMQQIASNLSDCPELRVRIPEVYSKYSTAKVLTTEFCEGSNIGNIEEIKSWGLDLEEVAKRLIELYCKMVLVDGFYHADPHPGNIFLNKEGELILLDFGAVAYLNEETKKAIPELIEAVIRNDTEDTVLALRKMGFVGSDKASTEYVKKLIEVFRDFLKEEIQLDGLNFQNIKLNSGIASVLAVIRKIDLTEVSNTIRIPKDYILLNRTIVLLSGDAFQLAPELNTLEVIRPYMKQQLLDEDNGFYKMAIKAIKSQITTALSLPSELSRFLKAANESEMEQELKGINEKLQKIYYLGLQFLSVFILIGLIYSLLNFDLIEIGWVENAHYGAIGLTSLLLLRSIYNGLKD